MGADPSTDAPLHRAPLALRLDHMAEFITLAETLSFTATAQRHFMTQPAVSRHIQAIEAALGTQLVDRSTHVVRLTAEGERVLTEFRKTVQRLELLRADIAARQVGTAGSLHVGAPYYGLREFLEPILIELEKRHPLLDVIVHSLQPHQIRAGLVDQTLQVGMVFLTDAIDQTFYYQHLAPIDTYAIRWRNGEPSTEPYELARLAEETLIITSRDHDIMAKNEEVLREAGVRPKAVVDAVQIDLVPQKLRTTGGVFMGADFLRRMAADDLDFHPLVADPPARTSLGFAVPAGPMNPTVATFLRFAQEFATTQIR